MVSMFLWRLDDANENNSGYVGSVGSAVLWAAGE